MDTTQLSRWKSSDKKLVLHAQILQASNFYLLVAYNFEPDGTSEEVSLNID